jgi:superfamily II DNA/RNA helicase
VHRIGRTGRAGRSGRAFTIAIPEDGKYIALIEALIGRPIPRITLDGMDEAELEPVGRRRRAPRGTTRVGRKRQPTRTERRVVNERAGPPSERPVAKAEGSAQPHLAPARQEEKHETTVGHAAGSGANDHRRPRPPRPVREPVEKTVVGMGDHVPAFILRDVPLRKKA